MTVNYEGFTAAQHIAEGQRLLGEARVPEAAAHFAAAQAINGLPAAPAAAPSEGSYTEYAIIGRGGSKPQDINTDRAETVAYAQRSRDAGYFPDVSVVQRTIGPWQPLGEETPAENVPADADSMTDEELLASPLGTRVRQVLDGRLGEYATTYYTQSKGGATASAIMGGITEARKCVYPEAMWDGFRDAAEWDEPYTPTDEDRAELMRRIEERGGVRDYSMAERIAMDIADERLAGKE